MKFDINKNDLWTLRFLLDRGIRDIGADTAFVIKMGKAGRRGIRKLNKASIKLHGHDLCTWAYEGE
jgi:hypothetical protein